MPSIGFLKYLWWCFHVLTWLQSLLHWTSSSIKHSLGLRVKVFCIYIISRSHPFGFSKEDCPGLRGGPDWMSWKASESRPRFFYSEKGFCLWMTALAPAHEVSLCSWCFLTAPPTDGMLGLLSHSHNCKPIFCNKFLSYLTSYHLFI